MKASVLPQQVTNQSLRNQKAKQEQKQTQQFDKKIKKSKKKKAKTRNVLSVPKKLFDVDHATCVSSLSIAVEIGDKIIRFVKK